MSFRNHLTYLLTTGNMLNLVLLQAGSPGHASLSH